MKGEGVLWEEANAFQYTRITLIYSEWAWEPAGPDAYVSKEEELYRGKKWVDLRKKDFSSEESVN